MRRCLTAVISALVAASALAACGADGDTYDLTARFPSAVALYEDSDVLVMGVPVGSVESVTVDGDSILVDMKIRNGVPLPADVIASIHPSSLIGERNVILSPAWKPGDETLPEGTELAENRTRVPVEPDDALQSITDLLSALEPDSVARLFEEGSQALDGNGATINSTLLQLSQLIPYLAEQDDELVAISADVNALADVVRARDDEIGTMLDNFATVATALAAERDQIISFVENLASLARQGQILLTAYETTLPESLDVLGSVALTVQANASSVAELLQSFDGFGTGVVEAYDPVHHTLRAKIYIQQSLMKPFEDLLGALGL